MGDQSGGEIVKVVRLSMNKKYKDPIQQKDGPHPFDWSLWSGYG